MSATKFKQNLDVTGDINLSGNIVIGSDIDADNVTFNADITSHIIPDANTTYDIGTSTKTWREIFTSKVNSAAGDDLDIHSGSDIALYPAGNIWIKQDTKLIFEGTAPDEFEAKLQATSVTADRDIILPDEDGTLATREYVQLNMGSDSSGSIVANEIQVSYFVLEQNGTPQISSDSELLLNAERVEISSGLFKLNNVTTVQRDTLFAENGDMIYNSTTNKFQGYANGVWVDLH